MPSRLAGHRARELCPSCFGPGGECQRCNGSGYVYVDTYDESRGIGAPDAAELEHERLKEFCRQHQVELDRLRAELIAVKAERDSANPQTGEDPMSPGARESVVVLRWWHWPLVLGVTAVIRGCQRIERWCGHA